MRIVRSVQHDGTLAPGALNYLREIPEQYLYLHNHARRHPLGIYNVSLEQLEKDFDRLLAKHAETLELIEDNVHVDGALIKNEFPKGIPMMTLESNSSLPERELPSLEDIKPFDEIEKLG